MHAEAWAFLRLATLPYRYGTPAVVEFGSRDINGSPRALFPYAHYTGIDIEPGPGVDIVADASTWEPDGEYDVAVCAEVMEHTPVWGQIIATAYLALRVGGLFVVTAATDPRAPHSAGDGGPLRPGEYYANIEPESLGAALSEWFAKLAVVVHPRGDVYASGIKCAPF